MKKLLTLLLLACLLAPACAMAADFSITDQNGNAPENRGDSSIHIFDLSGGSTYTLSGDTALPVQLNLTGSGEATLILSGVSISMR